MHLQHIELNQLKTTNVNVRKVGAKDIDDLLPSIRSLGILQPLLVRSNCEGFEVVAGQRRYHSLVKLAEEGIAEPVPCIIMDEGDDAKAIEASLAENIARLPMNELDQFRAFAALIDMGQTVEGIASHFGVTERLVKQRLAIANLIPPILTLYQKEEVSAETVRILTMATKRQQKAWIKLYQSDDEYAPLGGRLKDWLFGGDHIPTSNALFDVATYKGNIASDLFGEDDYFADSEKFWLLQSAAIAEAKEKLEADGWSEVIVLDIGAYWTEWEFRETAKEQGGKIYVQIAHDGEVNIHQGYLSVKEAAKREKAESGGGEKGKTERPELTKVMQSCLDLHRHSAVRTVLLDHAGIALRLAIAQIIAGSSLWTVKADMHFGKTEKIAESLQGNKAEAVFDAERDAIRDLLNITEGGSVVPYPTSFGNERDLEGLFATLLNLDDETVMRVLTFVVAETLPCGSASVEVLGEKLSVDLVAVWQVDECFLELLRDKEAINAVLKEIGGKAVADAHVASTATVQKKIISDYLNGTRQGGAKDWTPRYSEFPMRAYTKRGGIDAIDRYKAVKKLFA